MFNKYVLPKGAFLSKTVATFVQKVGLIWLKCGFFASIIQDTNVVVGLKLLTTTTNVTTVLCTQGNKIKSGFKKVRTKTDVTTHTCQVPFKRKR